MNPDTKGTIGFLVLYLLFVSMGATGLIIANFPTEIEAGTQTTFSFATETKGFFNFLYLGDMERNRGYALLAFLAGVTGSFLGAGQSLTSFVGNASFKSSWTSWYLLRPWIGATLGLAIYFVLSAGLLTGMQNTSPYGVVALGLLGGWFSKNATDKLKDVFDVAFRSDEDTLRKNKMKVEQPIITSVMPNPVPPAQNILKINGAYFMEGASIQIAKAPLTTKFLTEKSLEVSLDSNFKRPVAGSKVMVQVKNPEGPEPLSKEFEIEFQ